MKLFNIITGVCVIVLSLLIGVQAFLLGKAGLYIVSALFFIFGISLILNEIEIR